MKKTFFIFFTLGMIMYNFIPRDYIPLATASVIPLAKVIYYDEAGNKCVIYNDITAECGK